MPALLDSMPTSSESETLSSERLRSQMAATKISFTWFGVRKTLSASQKERAADSFAAEAAFLSAAKKLLDTGHSAYRAVTAMRGQIVQHWRSLTLPYPEPGIRLIRQDDVAAFDRQMSRYQSQLQEAVEQLDRQLPDLKSSARRRLGDLYNSDDYPTTLSGEFAFSYEFPSVEPPDYLRQLNPRLYEQECQRVQERFNEAVEMAEQAFLEELGKLVSHLTERLSGSEDGKARVFRDSTIDNLTEFFERFRRLNIRSNAQLDDLVTQTQQIIQGVQPQELRDNEPLRQRINRQMASVQASLDGLLVDRPRRSIIRPQRVEET